MLNCIPACSVALLRKPYSKVSKQDEKSKAVRINPTA